jgi:hypothetical protein
MTKFFSDLTRQNWGFPWHIILADILATGFLWLYLSVLPAVHLGFYYAVTWLSTNAIGYAYEVYQAKQDPANKEEFWEDMAANNAGIVLACLAHYVTIMLIL